MNQGVEVDNSVEIEVDNSVEMQNSQLVQVNYL